MGLERQIITRLLADPRLELLSERGVSPDFFKDHRRTLEHILEHRKKYGTMPTETALKTDYSFEVEEALEPLEYYVDKMLERETRSVMLEGIGSVEAAIRRGDFAAARRGLTDTGTAAARIGATSEIVLDVMAKSTVKLQRDRYELIKKIGGPDGIITPWGTLNEATYGWHEGETILIVARPGTGKCVAEDTPIYDPLTGEWPSAKDAVHEQRKLLTFEKAGGRFKSVKPFAHLDTGIKACVEVETRSGRRITVTPEHPFLTQRGWAKASELQQEDYIAAAKMVPEPEMPVNQPIGEVELLAALLSEGGYTGSSVTITSGCAAFLSVVKKAASAIGCEIHKRKHGKYDYGIKGNIRAKLLKKYGLGHEKATEKRVPVGVFRLPYKTLIRFIEVLWAGDGYIDKRGCIGIGLGSEGMIDDIQKLLMRFGISGRKRVKISRCNGRKFKSWEFIVDSTSREAFKTVFTDIPGPKSTALAKLNPSCNPNIDAVPVSKEIRERIITIAKVNRKHKGVRPADREGLFTKAAKCLGLTNPRRWGAREFLNKHNSGRVSRRMFQGLIRANKGLLHEFEWLSSPDIIWDRVEKVQNVGERRVFDFTVLETHNFVANGLVAHNTFFLLFLAWAAWQMGKKVLIVTMEMSKIAMIRRFYAILAGVPHHRLRKGTLGAFDEKKLWDALDLLAGKGGLHMIGAEDVSTVPDVERVVNATKPDIVFVDGVYLFMDWKKATSMWERVTNIADDITLMAHRQHVPVAITAQFNKQVNLKSLRAGMENVGLSDRLPQNADVILALFRNQDHLTDKTMLVRLLKNREDELVEFLLNWNFMDNDFTETGLVGREGDSLVKGVPDDIEIGEEEPLDY